MRGIFYQQPLRISKIKLLLKICSFFELFFYLCTGLQDNQQKQRIVISSFEATENVIFIPPFMSKSSEINPQNLPQDISISRKIWSISFFSFTPTSLCIGFIFSFFFNSFLYHETKQRLSRELVLSIFLTLCYSNLRVLTWWS